MEEYITRAEFEQFKRHMEQKTEEMKAIRVDVHNVDVEAIKQEFHTVSNTWLETLQEHYTEHKEDLKAMATKDDLEAMKREILDAIRNISSPGKN